MSQLGKAYVEVIADLKRFPADLRRKLKAALTEATAGVEFDGLEKKAEQAGEHSAEAASRGFKRKARQDLGKAGEEGGRSILGGLRRVFSRDSGEGRGFFSTVGSFFTQAFSQAGQAASQGASSAGNVFSSIGGAFGKIGDVGGEVGSVLKIAAFAVLIPIVIQLAGALVQLGGAIFALPAAFGVAAAAIAPLIIGFQGFGEAVGAGLSGDTEKFNEALKGLAPSARSVVKEFVSLGPVLKSIKATVQQALFAPLVGAIKPLATTLLPMLRTGLGLVAGALGRMLAGFADLFASNDIVEAFGDVFESTARIVDRLSPSLVNLTGVLIGVMEKGLPFVERFFGSLSGGIDSLTAWLSRIQQNSQLNDWLERAAHILGTIVSIAKTFGIYLAEALGGEIGDNGTKFLDDFKVKLEEMLAFIRSPAGKETLHNLGVLLKWVGNIFIFLIGLEPAMAAGFNGIFDAVRLLGRVFQTLGGWVVAAGKAVGSFFVTVWGWITSAGSAIGDFFTKTIPSWWDSVVEFFTSLPGRVVAALSGFRDAGRNFIVDTLRSWYEQVFQWIGNIIAIFLSLPQLIPAAFEVLGQKLSELWTAIWQGAIDLFNWGVRSTLGVIEAIPALAATIWENIKAFFVGLWNDVVVDSYNAVVSGFNRVVDFFSSLPDRVKALGPRLYQAAVDLGHKIGDGLSNIGNFASDIGHRIVDTIKSGINWVIRSINNGIAEIDDQLPGSLPRIPMLARGAVIDSPTLALVGEAGPEVVVPLGNRKRAQELAEQSGLLSMLRGAGGGTTVNVVAYLDPSGVIIPIAKTIVNDTLDQQGDELAYARAA